MRLGAGTARRFAAAALAKHASARPCSSSAAEYELFRKFARDRRDCVDLGHSDSPEEPARFARLDAELHRFVATHPHGIGALTEQFPETLPSELRRLAARGPFARMGGFGTPDRPVLTGEHVHVWPETSTYLLKSALVVARQASATQAIAAGRRVLPATTALTEGAFRYGDYATRHAETEITLVPVEVATRKVAAPTLARTLDAVSATRAVAAFVLDTPNNPWMQVYRDDELREIVKVCTDRRVRLINDTYLLGTEDPSHRQRPVAATIDEVYGASDAERDAARANLFTVMGTRRLFGADKRAKAGFAATHDLAFARAVEDRLRTTHSRWNVGRYREVEGLLRRERGVEHTTLRTTLAAARERTEAQIDAIDGMRVVVPAHAGPFVVAGFAPEVEARMRDLGFEDATGDLDGRKIAEYVTVAGSPTLDARKSVTLLPLSTMFTRVPGFRVNATVAPTSMTDGFASVRRALDRLDRGLRRDAVEPAVSAVYDEIRRARDAALGVTSDVSKPDGSASPP